MNYGCGYVERCYFMKTLLSQITFSSLRLLWRVLELSTGWLGSLFFLPTLSTTQNDFLHNVLPYLYSYSQQTYTQLFLIKLTQSSAVRSPGVPRA